MTLKQLLAGALAAFLRIKSGASLHVAYDTSDAGPHHVSVTTVGGQPLVTATQHVSIESALEAIGTTAVVEAISGAPTKQIEADAEAGAEAQAVTAGEQIITSQLPSDMAEVATGESASG